jgi:hypothetical protein
MGELTSRVIVHVNVNINLTIHLRKFLGCPLDPTGLMGKRLYIIDKQGQGKIGKSGAIYATLQLAFPQFI